MLHMSSFYIIIFFSQATISIKIRNFLICFCSFDLSYSILEKDNFIAFFMTFFLTLFPANIIENVLSASLMAK